MSQGAQQLITVLVDGETKTGKGAASKAIAQALQNAGYQVYYDVAGDFYRRFVALVRLELKLTEDDVLPTGPKLNKAAHEIHQRREAYNPELELGDLQRPAISKSVAVLAELPIAQQAGAEWWQISIVNAISSGADVFVVDGRNPRDRVKDVLKQAGTDVVTALDLYLTCDPREAARRNLLLSTTNELSSSDIEAESVHILERRTRDRQRDEYPFLLPKYTVTYDIDNMTSKEILDASWIKQEDFDPPVTVILDNTYIAKETMINAVSDLAVAAVRRITHR